MCFSAGASFGSSAILGVVGVLAIKKTTSSSQVLFAAIPLLFAVQQFTEGFVWLSLSNPEYASFENISVHTFLVFAQVIWPVWVPLSVLLFDKNQERKRMLLLLTGMGIIVSSYLGYHMFLYPVHSEISSYHIHYDQHFPIARLWYSGIFYFIPTVVPLLISKIKDMWIMGATILISYIVTHVFYEEYLISVWCFFAAIISVVTLLILREAHKNTAIDNTFKFNHM